MFYTLTDNTFKFTYVNSGVTPSEITASIFDGSETLVSSGTMTSSGNGHYFRLMDVSTPGYYAAQVNATIESNPYRKREIFQAGLKEVD